MPRLKEKFTGAVADKLTSEYKIANRMQLPKLEKIVLNVGLGNQLEGTKINAKARQQVIEDLALISGQKPIMKKAKRAISNFKLRKGYEVGAMVTLRGNRMWEFLDRLINLSIPRIKDFRGLNDKSFDGQGNYSFGVQEQAIFPEIDMTNAQYTHGMNINLIFSNSNDKITRTVLTDLGMPFKKTDNTKNK